MITRTAQATWTGNLKQGKGSVLLGACDQDYSFDSRFGQGAGSNPEELLGAAHAGCFSMAFALMLGEAGYEPKIIRTGAKVYLDPQELRITKVALSTEADVPEIEGDILLEIAEQAKRKCPVSRALSGVEIELEVDHVVQPA